ncbi:N-acetylglucosaminyl-diphospho-decaprenol L-rhamnosyltransferase [Clostridium tertium]|uniref:N-acetylglucosaminyl-diphospho-decaprenol L-rhamnosyltransferase n=1 Tax=Clostridium tertium TaxID=1559 RepID=A0A6N3DRK1_9CLOT
MEAKVAIILVNYNGEKYNEECINSILKSTYKNYEIIVIDNNSTDNSVKLLEEKFNSDIKIIMSDSNLGFSGANNLGIKYALNNGFDYVMLLNNDTIIESDMIELMIDASDSKYVISPKIYYYDNKNIIWSAGGGMNWIKGLPIQYGINELDSYENNKKKNIEFATGCCILIPIECIEKIGLMSEEYFLYYEDTDYCVRMIRSGYEIYFEPKAVMYHKVSASTGGEKSKTYWYYMIRNRLLFNKKFNEKIFSYRLYFFLTTSVKLFKYLFKRERVKLEGTINGIFDFFKGAEGKVKVNK